MPMPEVHKNALIPHKKFKNFLGRGYPLPRRQPAPWRLDSAPLARPRRLRRLALSRPWCKILDPPLVNGSKDVAVAVGRQTVDLQLTNYAAAAASACCCCCCCWCCGYYDGTASSFYGVISAGQTDQQKTDDHEAKRI